CELPARELLPGCKCGEQFRDHERRRVKHQDGAGTREQQRGNGERRPAADLRGVAAHDQPQRRAQAVRIAIGFDDGSHRYKGHQGYKGHEGSIRTAFTVATGTFYRVRMSCIAAVARTAYDTHTKPKPCRAGPSWPLSPWRPLSFV